MSDPFGGQYLDKPYNETAMQARVAREPTLQERLDLAVRQAEERLKAVQEARDIFMRNPDLEKLLNIMQKGLF